VVLGGVAFIYLRRGGRREAVSEGNYLVLRRVGTCLPPINGGHKARRYAELENGDLIWCRANSTGTNFWDNIGTFAAHKNRPIGRRSEGVRLRRTTEKPDTSEEWGSVAG